jgi:hypothetical protein
MWQRVGMRRMTSAQAEYPLEPHQRQRVCGNKAAYFAPDTQAAEKMLDTVIPSEARNLCSI